ncbi:MAG: hypothetical protein ABIO38_08170, partial [Luteimonas sp.]
DPCDVELAATVPYSSNTLVLFLNSLQAVHGVTPRQVTPRTRYFFNLVGEIPVPLFDLDVRQRPRQGMRRAWARIGRIFSGRASAAYG